MNNKTIQNDLKKLTAKEREIYHSVMQSFPATQHLSALNVAMQGGVKWDFKYK